MNLSDTLVLIKGAGDLATGVAVRLYRCGFTLVMTELPNPLMVRRTVAFGEAVYEDEVAVEGIRARRAGDVQAVRRGIADGTIPVLIDPETRCLSELAPAVLVDAVMAKANTGTRLGDAPLVIALGLAPGLCQCVSTQEPMRNIQAPQVQCGRQQEKHRQAQRHAAHERRRKQR